jgi:hypothetical protein
MYDQMQLLLLEQQKEWRLLKMQQDQSNDRSRLPAEAI